MLALTKKLLKIGMTHDEQLLFDAYMMGCENIDEYHKMRRIAWKVRYFMFIINKHNKSDVKFLTPEEVKKIHRYLKRNLYIANKYYSNK